MLKDGGLGTILAWLLGFKMEDEKEAKFLDTVRINWQQKRSEVRKKSVKSKYVRSSLQSLNDSDVLLKLESILKRKKTSQMHKV